MFQPETALGRNRMLRHMSVKAFRVACPTAVTRLKEHTAAKRTSVRERSRNGMHTSEMNCG